MCSNLQKKLISKILCYASSIILCSSLTDVICTSFMHIAPSHSSLKMEYKIANVFWDIAKLNKSKKSTIFFFVPLQFLASLGARHVMNRRLLFEIIQLLGKNMILFCWWYFVTIIFLSSAAHVIWLNFFGWFKSIVHLKKYLGSFKRIWPEMLLATIFLTRNGRKMRFQLCVPTTNRSCLPHTKVR